MSEIYKGFTLNEVGEPTPWGKRENAVLKQIIDIIMDGEEGGSVIDHNLLENLQGGNSDERFHSIQSHPSWDSVYLSAFSCMSQMNL